MDRVVGSQRSKGECVGGRGWGGGHARICDKETSNTFHFLNLFRFKFVLFTICNWYRRFSPQVLTWSSHVHLIKLQLPDLSLFYGLNLPRKCKLRRVMHVMWSVLQDIHGTPDRGFECSHNFSLKPATMHDPASKTLVITFVHRSAHNDRSSSAFLHVQIIMFQRVYSTRKLSASDTCHYLLCLVLQMARLCAVSFGECGLSPERWSYLMELENRRQARIRVI